jgi:hypothetical protein
MAARREALRLAARVVEQCLNADHSDHSGSLLSCPCGSQARYAGRRRKTFQSVLGELELDRAYYHCKECGEGFCPRDQQLGIGDSSLSPAIVRMIGTVGAMVSFQEGSQLLEELAAVRVDAKQVERHAEALGGQIAEDERRHTTPLTDAALPPTLYLGIDGTGIPMRPEALAGRVGRQTVPPRLGKSSSVRSGAPSHATLTARLFATLVLSLTPRPLKVRRRWISRKSAPSSPNACCGKPRAGALPKSPAPS